MELPKVEQNPEAPYPPLLGRLRSYWELKRDGRLMPSRRDIVPSEIKPQLPNVLLVDVIDGGCDFRYRLVGSNLQMSFRSPPTGSSMSEMLQAFGAETTKATLATYRHVASMKEPLRIRGPGAIYAQNLRYFDSFLAPLSDDGQTVNMIFGGFFFDWDKNRQPHDANAGSLALAGRA